MGTGSRIAGVSSNMVRASQVDHTDSGHNKTYRVEIIKDGDTYKVVGKWGKIGGTLQEQIKYEGKSEAKAQTVFDDLLDSKFKKGYH